MLERIKGEFKELTVGIVPIGRVRNDGHGISQTARFNRCSMIGRAEPEAKLMAATNLNQWNGKSRRGFETVPYLCSKSTGAVTSCTRKYLASAGHFRATASYIA
jgi:hypothetical protein